jgi:hypothetical protein
MTTAHTGEFTSSAASSGVTFNLTCCLPATPPRPACIGTEPEQKKPVETLPPVQASSSSPLQTQYPKPMSAMTPSQFTKLIRRAENVYVHSGSSVFRITKREALFQVRHHMRMNLEGQHYLLRYTFREPSLYLNGLDGCPILFAQQLPLL